MLIRFLFKGTASEKTNVMSPGTCPGPRFRSKLRGIYRERLNAKVKKIVILMRFM
jgi:hypothetical protein